MENPPDPSITPKKEHHRSMSADTSNPTLTPTTPRRFGSLTHSPRLRDLARRACSPEKRSAPLSPLKRSAPVTPVGPRFWSVKSSAPTSPAPRWMLPSPRKIPESSMTIVESLEVPESPTPSPRLPRRVIFSFNVNVGTPMKPLVDFRGGMSWLSLPRDKSKLGLDLFSSCAQGQENINCLDLMELKPLCQFRGLRSLKLFGMMQSYQTYIWQTAWLNLGLDELELGMVLKPEILSVTHGRQWSLVEEGWSMNEKQTADPVYHGHLGDGELHPRIGYGEYLDKHSIEKAKLLALTMDRTSHRLTIKTLTLSGFVVDADPFLQWFDPQRLRSIHFKGECIDAGFWLPLAMQKVTVRCSRNIDLEPVPVGILALNLPRDLRVVELKDGKKIHDVVFGDSGIVMGRP
ncbi:hypothetical protein N7448_001972 [Penicillium atrosanguineum]|uniref:Uncharacterized protein n=1 Tax=Penicillium atrosanguineum TaxID=1132637 RepID=A0A9W9PTA2_9EURO|nr:hypothetical protein N7526_006421 [Penicillium atrosanguineum]KAJ5144580.1 hypothetical protein N7448_001972 [Penicillium atrosanguineum]KAJ5311010.1 hypothetical protein N7476_006870 [Penicillium atrosanguineum]